MEDCTRWLNGYLQGDIVVDQVDTVVDPVEEGVSSRHTDPGDTVAVEHTLLGARCIQIRPIQ